MLFLEAFGSVFSLIIVVSLGYALAARGWFDKAARKIIPRLVTNICLPPFLCATIITDFPRENLGDILAGVALPAVALVALFILAFLAGKLLKVNRRHFWLFCACISNPNTIFIGLPVNMALFGTASTPYVLLYYFASTTFFWTIGNYAISQDERSGPVNGPAENVKFQWQKLVSPPILGFLAGLAIMLGNLHVPAFLMRAAMMVGEMTTPLALLFIGITLKDIGLGNLRITRDIGIALAGRLFVSPLLVLLLLPLFNLPTLMGHVFIIQAALPVIMQIPILSAYYGTDPAFGTMMVALSTLLCILTVPFWSCFL